MGEALSHEKRCKDILFSVVKTKVGSFKNLHNLIIIFIFDQIRKARLQFEERMDGNCTSSALFREFGRKLLLMKLKGDL